MSYCRWSTDDGRSDVYVYHDIRGGWTTHVRGGEDYNDPTSSECADRLVAIREAGHYVPQGAIDNLRAEAAELSGGSA